MSDFFRRESLDYKKNQLFGQIFLKQPLLYKLLTYGIIFLMLSLVFYVYFGKINRKAEVQGYLEPTVGVMRYTSPLQGYIREICVCEHQYVEEGTHLIRIVAEHHCSRNNELYYQRLKQIEQRKA